MSRNAQRAEKSMKNSIAKMCITLVFPSIQVQLLEAAVDAEQIHSGNRFSRPLGLRYLELLVLDEPLSSVRHLVPPLLCELIFIDGALTLFLSGPVTANGIYRSPTLWGSG